MLQVRAGADYIITQASLNSENLMRFLQNCKEQIEINVPIFLGFFIYDSFDDLRRKCKFCNVNMPDYIFKLQNQSKEDITNFLIQNCKSVLTQIEEDALNFNIGGIHLYTFNQIHLAKEIINALGNFCK